MSCDHEYIVNDDHELKLTKEYKYLLSYIRPLIDQLEKSRDVQLCLLWLSKLEQCASWERDFRNKILAELCKQVKSNCLKPPFNNSPPSGPLRNIVCADWKANDYVITECSEAEPSTEEALSSSSHQSYAPLKTVNRRQAFSGFWRGGFNARNKGTKKSNDVLDHSECFAIQKAYHEKAQSDQVVIEKYQEIIKSLVSQQLKGDVSPNRLKKLKSSYEVKLMELVQSIKKEQGENALLKKKLDSVEEDLKNVEILKSDIESLRQKVLELESEKNCLESKCQQAEEEKSRSVSDLKSKLCETEKKLKESEKRFKALEKMYQENYCSFESECHAKASEKEKVYLKELSTLEKVLEEKQSEINCLKEEMDSQKNYFEEQITRLKQKLEETPNLEKEKEKMKNLKIKAKKLEKVQEHMTVLFQSQLQQILAKKDFYIASLEMQLKMNNSDSGGNIFSSDLNDSLDQKISNLETQYRKLLEDSEKQSIKRRHLDLQKIHTLQKQLLSYGEVIMDNEPKSDESITNLLLAESGLEAITDSGKA